MIIQTGGRAAFSAAAYSLPHPDTYAFVEKFNTAFDQYVAPQARAFFAAAEQLYTGIDRSAAMRAARALGRKFGTIWQQDEIQELHNIGELQNPPMCMVPYMMAEMTVRDMYHNQQCEGYAGIYTDQQPGVIGEQHYHYRRVMSGQPVEHPDDTYEATTYFDVLRDAADDLVPTQQCDMLTTWQLLRNNLRKRREDPTSPWNANLGV